MGIPQFSNEETLNMFTFSFVIFDDPKMVNRSRIGLKAAFRSG